MEMQARGPAAGAVEPGKVLVTGGAGFIGSHLCERLLGLGYGVVCLDNFNDFYDPAIKRSNIAGLTANPGFTLREGDIRDAALVNALFEREKPEAVVHLAAMAGVRPSIEKPVLYYDINVTGTAVLLETAGSHGVANFIFGSSSSVYGNQKKIPFCERDPVSRPISPYAASKAAGELLCYACHHLSGLPVTCLRFFTVYGPRQRPEMAIHLFAKLIRDGKPVTVYGDGHSRRDYTFVDDIIDGIVKALEKPHGYEIFNLGESRTVELFEVVGLIEKGIGRKARLRMLPVQPGDVPVTFADIDHARSSLGYSPSIPIEEGIGSFIEWFSRNVEGS